MNKDFAFKLLLNSPGKVKITHKKLPCDYLYSTEKHNILCSNGEQYIIGDDDELASGWEMITW